MSSECTLESSVTSNSEFCKIKSRIGSIHPLGKQMLASSIASSISVISLNPLQVVKIQYQNSTKNVSLTSIIKHIYTQNGIQGFWSGFRMGLIQAVPNTVLYMSCYEYMKLHFHQYSFGSGIAGAISRTIAVSIITPLELIRTIQSNGSSLSGIQIASETYRKEGIKGFYRGWQSSVLRDAPYSAIYWYSFDRFKILYSNLLHNHNNNHSSHHNHNSGQTYGDSNSHKRSYNNLTQQKCYEHQQQQQYDHYVNNSNNNNNNNSNHHHTMNNSPSSTTHINTPLNSDHHNHHHHHDNSHSMSNQHSRHIINFMAGASAGIIAAIVTHPFDVLKTHQQLSTTTINSCSSSGSGNSVNVKSGDRIHSSSSSSRYGHFNNNFYSYLRANSSILPSISSSSSSSSSSLLSPSAYYSYIMNTCHDHTCLNNNYLQYHLNSTYYTPPTQPQLHFTTHPSSHSHPNHHHHHHRLSFPIISQLYQLVRKGGGSVSVLYRGLSMRLATVIPGSAIVITVYEAVKHFE